MNSFWTRALVTGAFTAVLGTPVGGAFAASALAADDLSPQTRADLDQSMRGEALANASYRLYAEQARQEGLPAVADLFERTADVELGEHFKEEADLAGLVGTTRDNLSAAIAGEHYEAETMYPTFAERAEAAGDTEAATRFAHNAKDEADHARAFEEARNQLP
ncbi:rubrerythrin family protein [Marinitenerispora sediminis]|uniref:Rubrerythrin n=1 Tax=Marinitenerispora sediminis TaxID=1931232 RepID=A0A368T9D3_9ACTN|nr:rubrerythrin family protein [Marinitenerispora sediminis]RCV51101.1 rubrerythrin [Marinitenerispora sediminis]RCV54611.1 rubrerythrin [Marinitenerispora sediminis]RCV61161.1 rubrerythrin [Marinitenerispora sediminis]